MYMYILWSLPVLRIYIYTYIQEQLHVYTCTMGITCTAYIHTYRNHYMYILWALPTLYIYVHSQTVCCPVVSTDDHIRSQLTRSTTQGVYTTHTGLQDTNSYSPSHPPSLPLNVLTESEASSSAQW